MENDRIVFETEEGKEEYYILAETKLGGKNYILVTDDKESMEGSFLVLKEDSSHGTDGIASYMIPEDDDELKAVIKVFDELLEDIDLEV